MLKLLVQGTKWTRFSGGLRKMLFSLEYWSWNDIFECNIKKSIVPWRWDKRFFGKKIQRWKFSWMKMKKRNKFSFFGDRRFKNLRRGDSLKIGNLKSNLKVKNRRYLSSLRFLKHRELYYCYNLRWISRIPQDLPSKSYEFPRFAEESKNSHRNLAEKFEYDRAQDPCTISPRIFLHESSDKRLLLLSACIGKIFSCFMPRKCIVWYTNRAPSYTRCFPMREILYATSENVMKTGRNTAKLVIISGMDPPPPTISLVLPVQRITNRTN